MSFVFLDCMALATSCKIASSYFCFQCIFRSFHEHILLVYHVATFTMTVKVAEAVLAFTVMHTGVACTHPT